MPVKFENSDVEAKYEACREKDGHVHVPAGKNPGSGYAGPLSKITLAAADKAAASGSNILKLKEPAKADSNKGTKTSADKDKT